MSAVHASRGPLKPASPFLRSEVDIVCSIAEATLGTRRPGAVVGVPRRLHPHPQGDLARGARAARRTTRRSTSPAGSCCPHPPRDSRTFPTEADKGHLQRQPDGGGRGPRGPAAAAEPAQPRPVQHHDLRAQRPLPRHLRRPAGGVPARRRHRGLRLRRRRPRRPGQRVGGRHRTQRCRRSGSSSTTPLAAARRRTTPRSTRWARSTRRPTGATSPPTSRSSSGSRRRPASHAGSEGAGDPVGSDLGHKSDVAARPAELTARLAHGADCLFCPIASGETEASIVWSDDDFVAFLDIRPLFKGHTLLIPREHVVTLPDLPGRLRDPFLAAAQRLAPGDGRRARCRRGRSWR